MAEITARMRWYPGDVLVPVEEGALQNLEEKYGVKISLEEVEGKNRSEEGGIMREETMDSAIEEVTQTVVTLSSGDETAFRGCVKEIIRMYRAPRTIFSLMGSSERGEQIVKEIAGEDDGWM